MKPLLRAFYFWYQRRIHLDPTNVLRTFDQARSFLVHLPSAPGRTMLCLPAVAALAERFPRASFSAVGPAHDAPLLACSDLFAATLLYREPPVLFSSEHKRLAPLLAARKADIYVDFNEPGSRELALLSHSSVRLGFYAEGGFPYFNFLIHPESTSGLARYSALVRAILGVRPDRLIEFKVPVALRRRAQTFLRSAGWTPDATLVLTQVDGALPLPAVPGRTLWSYDLAQLTDRELLPGLVALAQLLVVPPGTAFDLALGLRRPAVLVLLGRRAAGVDLPPGGGYTAVADDGSRVPVPAVHDAMTRLLTAGA